MGILILLLASVPLIKYGAILKPYIVSETILYVPVLVCGCQ